MKATQYDDGDYPLPEQVYVSSEDEVRYSSTVGYHVLSPEYIPYDADKFRRHHVRERKESYKQISTGSMLGQYLSLTEYNGYDSCRLSNVKISISRRMIKTIYQLSADEILKQYGEIE